MSHLVGKGLALMEGKTDEEIVDACLQVLQSLFPEKVKSPNFTEGMKDLDYYSF